MAKKIIFSIVFIILFIGSILAIYFGIGYFNEKNKWQDSSNSDYIQEIENYKEKIKNLEKNINELSSMLNDKIIELNAALADNVNDKEQIKNLSNEISELKNKITELNQLLDAYSKYEGTAVEVQFYIKDKLNNTVVLSKGEKLTYPVIEENIDYDFAGWSTTQNSLDNIIDVDTYNPQENVKLYAVFTCNLKIYRNGQVLQNDKILINSSLILPNINKYDDIKGYVFKGFYDDEDNYYEDGDVVDKHLTLYANYSKYVDIKDAELNKEILENGYPSWKLEYDYGFTSGFLGLISFDFLVLDGHPIDINSSSASFEYQGQLFNMMTFSKVLTIYIFENTSVDFNFISIRLIDGLRVVLINQ